jgi:hypothetical protein
MTGNVKRAYLLIEVSTEKVIREEYLHTHEVQARNAELVRAHLEEKATLQRWVMKQFFGRKAPTGLHRYPNA